MELHLIEVGTRWHEQALDLRFELFFEKAGLPRNILFDGKEEKSVHIGVIHHNRLWPLKFVGWFSVPNITNGGGS